MKTITVEYLEANFDDIILRVEKGEQFMIQSYNGYLMLMPYDNLGEKVDDLIRIHINHEEGS